MSLNTAGVQWMDSEGTKHNLETDLGTIDNTISSLNSSIISNNNANTINANAISALNNGFCAINNDLGAADNTCYLSQLIGKYKVGAIAIDIKGHVFQLGALSNNTIECVYQMTITPDAGSGPSKETVVIPAGVYYAGYALNNMILDLTGTSLIYPGSDIQFNFTTNGTDYNYWRINTSSIGMQYGTGDSYASASWTTVCSPNGWNDINTENSISKYQFLYVPEDITIDSDASNAYKTFIGTFWRNYFKWSDTPTYLIKSGTYYATSIISTPTATSDINFNFISNSRSYNQIKYNEGVLIYVATEGMNNEVYNQNDGWGTSSSVYKQIIVSKDLYVQEDAMASNNYFYNWFKKNYYMNETLPKGKYTFVDTPSYELVKDVPSVDHITIPFECMDTSGITYTCNQMQLQGITISPYRVSDLIFYYQNADKEEKKAGGYSYGPTTPWTVSQTINVTADTAIPSYWYDWIAANTTYTAS